MTTHEAGYIVDVPYTDAYYSQLAPAMINFVAAMNGHAPRPLDDFDYCELGCGYGLSLLLHAAAYPQGRFHGIDLNAEHIEHARTRAERAGLSNLTLLAEGVSEELANRPETPRFDFITMHGLYSWVPTEIREVILKFAQKTLKPGGLLMLSYNCMPGCAIKAPLREMMRQFAAPLSENSLERARLGISYLQLMLDSQAPFMELNPSARKHAEFLIKQDLRYVAHEFLNDEWHPLYFHEANAELAGAGLSYAGSFPLWENLQEADIPARQVPFFANFTRPEERQQHKDFYRNTTFRNDIYVNGGSKTSATPADLLSQYRYGIVMAPAQIPEAFVAGFAEYRSSPADKLFLAALQAGPKTTAELAADPTLSTLSREELLSLCIKWALIGAVYPIADEAGAQEGLSEANIEFLIAALSESASGNVWLASRRFGIAFEIESLQGLALWAESLSETKEGRAHALQQMLHKLLPAASGKSGAAELLQLAEETYRIIDDTGARARAESLGLI